MPNIPPSRDLTSITLAVLLIAALIAANIWIVRPFLPALIWAGMIVVATWSSMLRIEKLLWGSRRLAVVAMLLLFLLLFILPFALAVATIVENADQIVGFFAGLQKQSLPQPPDWLSGVPLIGQRLTYLWQQAVSAHSGELTSRLSPYLGSLTRWFVGQAGNLGLMLLDFLLIMVLAAILYSRGETVAGGICRFARRIAGQRGEASVRLAGRTIPAVAIGVLATAAIQSGISWIGLVIVGMPFASLLTALIFMSTVAQIGPTVILGPCVFWLYWNGNPGWGTVLLVWTIIVGTIDNFLRPLLIRQRVQLPLLLIFAGVIGGIIAMGIIGIFIGPVLLAVSYTLLMAWIEEEPTG